MFVTLSNWTSVVKPRFRRHVGAALAGAQGGSEECA